METYKHYVRQQLPERDRLEQLAEECAELSQAALKLIRARGYSKSYTPRTEAEAMANFMEEVVDVIIAMEATLPVEYKFFIPMEPMQYKLKWQRWAARLKEQEHETETD